MTDTKERILLTALRLFAKDGYEAVSVSEIAGELGMTKGALYKHYKNKRDIFDCIVERMYCLDAERSMQYAVPEETFEAAPTEYENVSMDQIRDFTIAEFDFWTEDCFASSFRKMLVLEQYRNSEMTELYQNCIMVGPVAYMEDIFREMMRKGALKAADAKLLALEFYAPLHLLIGIFDHSKDREGALGLLEAHIEGFVRQYAVHTAES